VSFCLRAGAVPGTVCVRELLHADGGDHAERPGADQALAAPGRGADAGVSMPKPPRTIEQHLYEEPYAFDFFQAVRLLRQLTPERAAVGLAAKPRTEAVRFRAFLSLNFPPSPIYELDKPRAADAPPLMTVAFLGLYGPSGMMPRHYT